MESLTTTVPNCTTVPNTLNLCVRITGKKGAKSYKLGVSKVSQPQSFRLSEAQSNNDQKGYLSSHCVES